MAVRKRENTKDNSQPKNIPILKEISSNNGLPNSNIQMLTEEIELLSKELSNNENLCKNLDEQVAVDPIIESAQESPEEMTLEHLQQPEVIYEKKNIALHFTSGIDVIFNWNDTLTYREFLNAIADFMFGLDYETKKQWEYSIKQARLQMKQQVSYIEQFVNKGVQKMKETETLMRDVFLEELHGLNPLEKFAASELVDSPDFSGLLEAIRAEIKNGTKVSYKLIQQLQFQLEELQHKEIETVEISQQEEQPHGAIISQQQLIDLTQEIETLKQRQKLSVSTVIKAIDMLDLIKNSAIQSKLESGWIVQIEQAIQSYLLELEKLDIQEIEALGKMLDGQYMISIGNVPKEAAPDYEKFEVCLVHERGFIEASTGKIIREAKVLSVY